MVFSLIVVLLFVCRPSTIGETLTRDIDEFGHCLLLQRAVVSSGIRALPTLGCCAILAGFANG